MHIWHDYSQGHTYFDNLFDSGDGDIRFRTKGSGTPVDAVHIQGDGNVGIGTTSPGTRKFVVSKTDAAPGGSAQHIYATNGQSGGALSNIAVGVDANGGYIQTLNSKPLLLNPGGNLTGIGATTSPGQMLHIAHATNARLRLEDSGTTGFGGTEFYDGVT